MAPGPYLCPSGACWRFAPWAHSRGSWLLPARTPFCTGRTLAADTGDYTTGRCPRRPLRLSSPSSLPATPVRRWRPPTILCPTILIQIWISPPYNHVGRQPSSAWWICLTRPGRRSPTGNWTPKLHGDGVLGRIHRPASQVMPRFHAKFCLFHIPELVLKTFLSSQHELSNPRVHKFAGITSNIQRRFRPLYPGSSALRVRRRNYRRFVPPFIPRGTREEGVTVQHPRSRRDARSYGWPSVEQWIPGQGRFYFPVICISPKKKEVCGYLSLLWSDMYWITGQIIPTHGTFYVHYYSLFEYALALGQYVWTSTLAKLDN
jgi:hypothetical protein